MQSISKIINRILIIKNTTFTNNVIVGYYDLKSYRMENFPVACRNLMQKTSEDQVPILQYDQKSGNWYFIDDEGNYKKRLY